ncbi:MAG: energy transducer TonB [Candidatus Alcyoniella australis]|nr:energy transducer TonB [Candidatus Alcyoniella australis]
MRIEPEPPRRPWIFRAALIGSLLVHGLLLAGFVAIGDEPSKESYVVDLMVTAPEPTPEPVAPEPTPPPAVPTPRPTPTTLPPPNEQVDEPPPEEPPKPVFGVTDDSVTDGDSSVAVRVGNTLMKDMEDEFTDPNDVHGYAGLPPGIHEATELDHPPKPTRMIKPTYPTLARRAGKEGRVILRILITSEGKVQQVQVVQGPGGNFGFEDSAVAAVRKWRYEKPTINGHAVDCWATLPIRFTLEN